MSVLRGGSTSLSSDSSESEFSQFPVSILFPSEAARRGSKLYCVEKDVLLGCLDRAIADAVFSVSRHAWKHRATGLGGHVRCDAV